MLKIISFVLFVATSIQVTAQINSANQSGTDKSNTDVAQLSALNAQFIQNFLHNDTMAHNKIIYKDFICIASNGAVINRDDYMKGWAHGYDTSFYKSFMMQNELIRVFGNNALVRAETVYTAVKEEKEITGTTIYTDTYIKVNDRWWCIQAQLTPKK